MNIIRIISIISIISIHSYIGIGFSQTKVDGLLTELKTAKHDTTRIKLYLQTGDEFEHTIPDSALYFYKKSLKLANKHTKSSSPLGEGLGVRYKKLEAQSLSNIGIIHHFQGNYPKALEYYQKSLKIYEELARSPAVADLSDNLSRTEGREALASSEAKAGKEGMSESYIHIGIIHRLQGNYPRALEYYQKSLKIDEELGDRNGMSYCYGNIGIIHHIQGNYPRALEYYQKSIKITEELGDRKGMSISYNNIGLIYWNQGNYPKVHPVKRDSLFNRALEYYQKSLKIREELGDRKGISDSYNNIGIIHYEQGNYSRALEYYQKSLKITEELGDRDGIATSLGNIAGLNIELKNYTNAIVEANKSLNIAKEIGALHLERIAYEHLFASYDSLRNYKKAYYYHKLYKQTNDSLFNEEKNEKITEMETRYETEKKEQQIKLLNKDKELQKTQLNKQKLIIWSGAGGLLLVITLAFFIYRGYRQKQKANLQLERKNVTITKQKEEIEAKNKDITDSIVYAEQIQNAILPDKEFTNKILGEHFIFFKPRDIVSGDFYWAAKIKNRLIVAAVDCTGHGVPGAFMSMLGVSFLNEIVNKQTLNPSFTKVSAGRPYKEMKEELLQANEILNQLRDEVINSLHQTGKKDEAQDGMDIALYIINMETKELQYAGANNPLYIVRRDEGRGSQTDANILIDTNDANKSKIQNPKSKINPNSIIHSFNHSLIEVKADRMPIGIYPGEVKPFTNNEIQLQKGDTLYIFSDGYTDQFGAPKGKRFKPGQFKELLLGIQAQTMEEQKETLNKTFEDWKGDLEQLDDVVVIGIRI